jgi:hypothetical protein
MAKFAALMASGALAPIVSMGLVGAAAASDYRCVRGDQTVRRVVVAADDAAQKVPCEVVYWKDTEQPGVRTVLWRAQTDEAFCVRKAEELVGTLREGGWTCAAAEGAPTQATRETTPAAVQSRPSQPDAGTEEQAANGREAAGEAAPGDQAAAPGQTGAAPPAPAGDQANDQREPADQQATPAVRAALAPPSAEPERPAGAAGEPAAAVLQAIIEQNLLRLNDGVEGRFAADIGGYGDLDGDGLEDGLVFFTYESERLGQARFVAAYLYDGESYALAATKPVAGSDDNVQDANIDKIEGGVISLRLSVLEPGDASCCPSGERQEQLVLRDGQLVEFEPSASPNPQNRS